MLKKLWIILPYMFLSVGFLGFLTGILISTGSINYKRELPLGEINGFVVDSLGNIYVGIGFYDKIQVYDSNGRFINNWPVDCNGGLFKVGITKEQNIRIVAVRHHKEIIYNKLGVRLMSDSTDNWVYDRIKEYDCKFIDSSGKTYIEKGFFFKKIVRTYPDRRTIISSRTILHIFRVPFNFIYWLIGIVMILIQDGKFNWLISKKS